MDVPSIVRNLTGRGPSAVLFALSRSFASLGERLYRPTQDELDAAAALEARKKQAQALREEQDAVLARNARFRDSLLGQRAFVIGNGPSLVDQDLNQLVGENLIATNAFCRHPIVQRQQLKALCLADPKWFDGSSSLLGDLAMIQSPDWQESVFVPLAAREAVEMNKLLPAERTFYCRMEGAIFEADSSTIPFDFTDTVPGVPNVSHMAIMVALFMGCDPIYLLGMDHDFFSPSVALRHFYTREADARTPIRDRGHAFGNELYLEEGLRTWRGHRLLRDTAEACGRRIINATAGGFLDVYDRADYDSLFKHQ